MALITLKHVSLSFGVDPVLDGVDLTIEMGERLCLVGRNGAGKSCLMKILVGHITPDSGTVRREDNVQIAYLPQDVPTDVTGTVYEIVAEGLGEAGALIGQYEEVSAALADDPRPELMDRLQVLQEALDANQGWDLQQQVDALIARHKLDRNARFESLSGGLKRRVLLAQSLVRRPDILLLDEPTNHLDIQAIEWLEQMLNGFPGAVVFVTHDRMFLRKVATQIVDLDRGKLRIYPGDFDRYQERKAADIDAEIKAWSEFDKKLSGEEAWIRQGIKARRTRNEGRVRALKKLREERKTRRERVGQAKIRVEAAQQSGRVVVSTSNLQFGYEKNPIIHDLTTTILRGDRVGFIGPNGCGKTTLLRLLLGQLEPWSGTVKLGSKREVLFFDQLRGQLDLDKSVQDNISDGHDTVIVQGRPRHVLGYLKDFLFSPLRARSPVRALSGGERNRLLLAKLFTKPANILVLDEPTNDLDAETLEMLEVVLLEFPGTVLLVSHDREFLNHVVTSTLAFDSDGEVRAYAGGYDDWLSQRPSLEPETPITTQGKPKSTRTRPARVQPALSYRERQELEELPTLIEEMEAEQSSLHEQLADPTLYQGDGTQLAALQESLSQLEAKLESTYERWTDLESKSDT